MKTILATVLLGATLTVVPPAAADSPGCVSRVEYDNLLRGLSTEQVGGRFDTYGRYLSSGSENFRRGYRPCWSDLRLVVVVYSLTTGLSVDWFIRDA